MKSISQKKLTARSFDFMLSAALAAVLLLIAYKILGVFVFGDNSLAAGDAELQYVPLMTELRERIFSGNLSGYSLANGLGTNFYATVCYYLASPVTLFAVLFRPLNVFDAFDLAILIKCALSAAAFSYAAKKQNGSFGAQEIAFSLCYAGCGFFVASYLNIMWLDALIFLPLIAYGIKKLVSDGKGVFYAVSLALSIMTCFYIGYMLCIFSVLYFFANAICNRNYVYLKLEKTKNEASTQRNKAFARVIVRFALCSLAAGLMAGAVLLPVISALENSATKAVTYPTLLFGLKDFLFSHAFGVSDTAVYVFSNAPVTYAGMLSLLLVPPFFFAKSIPLRERICGGILGALLFISMLIYPISLAWHGFTAPAGFLPRFVFIYSFLLVCAAYRAMKNLKSIHPAVIAISVSAVCALCLWINFSALPDTTYEKSGILALIFSLICGASVLLLQSATKARKAVCAILLLCVCAEFTASFCVNNYSINNKSLALEKQALVHTATELADNSDSLRTLFTEYDKANSMLGSFMGVNTIDTFSSFMDITATYAIANLGASHNYANSLFLKETTPLFNAYMSIGSIYDFDNSVQQKSLYYYGETLEGENGDSLSVYYPKYRLPVAFCVKDSYGEWNGLLFGTKSLEKLFQCTTGIDKPVFTTLTTNSVSPKNAHLADIEEGAYENAFSGGSFSDDGNSVNYFSVDKASEASVTFTYTAPSSEPLYLSYSSNLFNSVIVTCNEKSASYNYSSGLTSPLVALPECNEGDTLVLTAKLSEYATDYSEQSLALIKMNVYSLDMAVFEEGYEYLKEGALNVTEMTDSHICGSITAKSNQMLFTSIVYDKGWSIFIDGEKVDAIKTNNHLLAAELTKGEHSVEMRYKTPNLTFGVFLSLIGIVLIAIEAYTEKPRKKSENSGSVKKTSMFRF